MNTNAGGNFIEDLTWDEVARRVASGAAAILPIGAASKQHGFHLPMNTDRVQAEWLSARIADQVDALIWPTVTYGHYPAFVEYTGSSSLSEPIFEALVQEIVTGMAEAGCRSLFVLDTGVSTLAPVNHALARLAHLNVVHLKIHEGPRYQRAVDLLREQCHGSHADEIETSLMLALAPHVVDMTRAEASPSQQSQAPGPLTPSDSTSPNYSRSGSYGDPTRATAAKGEVFLQAMVDDLVERVQSAISGSGSTKRARP